MGFSVTEKSIGYGWEHIYQKNNGAGRSGAASAEAYLGQLHKRGRERSVSSGQTSAMELYERMRRFQAAEEEKEPGTDAPVEEACQNAWTKEETATAKDIEPASVAGKDAQEEEDSKTDTEVIVKPDGSRVLVVTMNVGGTETSMTLEISEPTGMPNENRTVGEKQPGQTQDSAAPDITDEASE